MTKSIFKSLTAHGGIIMILPTIIPIVAGLLGINISEGEVTKIVAAGAEVIGLIMVIYGRMRATGPATL